MAWVSTNEDVATELEVGKTINDVPVEGYPKTYSLIGTFSVMIGDVLKTYPAITADAWRRGTTPEITHARDERVGAFMVYVQKLEDVEIEEEPYRPAQ